MEMDIQPPISVFNPASLEHRAPVADAPPKQVAMAMERLNEAARIIADIRLSTDRILEALFIIAERRPSSKPVQLMVEEEASMRQHVEDLRRVGRLLEESGVLSDSLRSQSNHWGLHIPVVCPDGAAVVAYAWKRQLAGQAGASAVDRTRLALKAFKDHKRRYFPYLDCRPNRHTSPETLVAPKTLPDIIDHFSKEVPNVKISTYQRLQWLKRAASLPSDPVECINERSGLPAFESSSKKLLSVSDGEKVAVVEVFFRPVFRAVISLHPAGSTDPDAVAFFSPDEGGSYVHSRGSSVFQVYQQITEHAGLAVGHFVQRNEENALYTLLKWICSYENVFTKSCSKCGRLLAMDKQLGLLLPPIVRPYKWFALHGKDGGDGCGAYHSGCFCKTS